MLSTVSVALEQFRSIWERNVKVIAAKLTWLSPMTVTLLTLPFGILAAWLMATADTTVTGGWTLIAAGLTVGFCQLLDGLDGTLARATNRVTRFGDLLDHTMDRVLDILWIVAIGMNIHWVGDATLGWLAAMLTMFGSYMGTQAQAVTGSRDYSGFSRADRLVLTILALWGCGIMAIMESQSWGSLIGPWSSVPFNPMSLLLVVCGVGGFYTFSRRFMQAKAKLDILDKQKPLTVSDGIGNTDANDE